LQEACGADLPLAVVTHQSVEVYLRAAQSMRTIPLRILGPGESFGLFEILDQLYPPAEGSTQPPQWQVAAGAKSVYITSSFCTPPVGQALRSLLPPDIVEAHFPRRAGKSVAEQLSPNPYLFIRYMEKAALRAEPDLTPWTATVLIFPSSMILPMLRRKEQIIDAGREFLLQIHATAWIQSRNLRLRDVESAEIEQHVKGECNSVKHDFAKTIQHVLAISRGDLPAFVPYSDKLMSGPFSTVQDFFLSSKLRVKLAQRTFPAILQPCHLGVNSTQSQFGYFSLNSPSLVGEDTSFKKDDAKGLLSYLTDTKIARDFEIALYETLAVPVLRSDFAHQFRIAEEQWSLTQAEFFRDFKQGFTVRFVRIQQKAKGTVKGAGSAA